MLQKSLKVLPDAQLVRNEIKETLNSRLSIDDKILRLTALKAEILIALRSKGYKFETIL